jgi:hypothetical protein
MAKRITITFPSDRAYEFYATSVFWFAEALHSPIIHDGLGRMNDLDHARNVIWIDLADRHSLGKVKEIIRKTLARFSLTADAVVSISEVNS